MLRRLVRLPLRLRRPRRPRAVAKAVALVLGLLVLAEVLRMFAGNNRHEVIPGKVYRSNQPSEDGLREAIADLGIRTVINLRGYGGVHPNDWYPGEARATAAAGVSQEDVTLSALRLPPPAELRRLIDVLDHTEYPILFHCKAGADRTGLVATIVLLLYTDATLDRARRQLWPRYGHFRFGRAAAIDEFFDHYETWLAGRPHAPELFRDWALNHYSPGPARGTLRAADGLPDDAPRPAAADKWLALPVRATNTSAEAWELKPGNYAGIHVAFVVTNAVGETVYKGQAGLFRRTVRPGESLDLTLAVPPLRVPGRYVLKADLMDATGAAVPVRATTFYQFGNDPLMAFVEVK
jgi:protein tyrosine phosphatase (PTP) superfamily phosphohydrolase (DUF442 family)